MAGHPDVDAMHGNAGGHPQVWQELGQDTRLWRTAGGGPSIRRILANTKQQHELMNHDSYGRQHSIPENPPQQFME